MYKAYMVRMCRLGQPTLAVLLDEWEELRAESIMSVAWWGELGDVVHTVLRMAHPMAGICVLPIARKHARRELKEMSC
jgi:hypothetical protein